MGKLGYKCIVQTCNNTTKKSNDVVKFHSIPKDEKMCMMWLKNSNRMDLSDKSSLCLNKSFRICSTHFEKKMYFTERLLLPSAVPTIFTTTIAVAKTAAAATTSNTLCSTPIVPRQFFYSKPLIKLIAIPQNISMSDSTDVTPMEPVESVPNTSTTKRDWTHSNSIDLKSLSTLTTNNSASTDNNASKKQKMNQDKITSWANLGEQQQRAFIEQHKLKMELMREKHTVKLKMMVEKYKIEIDNLLLQKEILQLQKQNLL